MPEDFQPRVENCPAAVSRNAIRLERHLGVRLFNRSARQLCLTVEGEAFLGRAAVIPARPPGRPTDAFLARAARKAVP